MRLLVVAHQAQQAVGPGTWPDWIAAIFTSLAFVVAAVSYAFAIKDRREAQARLVYSRVTHVEFIEAGAELELLPHGAKIGNGFGTTIIMPTRSEDKARGLALSPLGHVTAEIHNGSNELIGPARIQMVNGATGKAWDTFSISVAAIDPESSYVVDFTWPNELHPGQPSLGTTVIFRDATGRWWRRHMSEPIEHVHADPENEGPPPKEREGIRAYQRRIGVPEHQLIPEPRVSLRVRWRRLLRRLRGRPSIP